MAWSRNLFLLATMAVALSVWCGATHAQAVGSAFTYQGELRLSGNPAVGAYDFQFRLLNAATGGSQVGATQIISSVGVANGLFSVALDFGPAQFAGDAQWLEIAVRQSGSGTFEVLTPRTAVTAAPYALGAVAALPNSVTGTSIVAGSVGASNVNASEVQRRVVGTCAGNTGIQGIGSDGTVVCGVFAGNQGTVTSIQTGTGLVGGPITAAGTISIAPGGVGLAQINTAEVQARVAAVCPPGQFLRGVASDGSPTCAPDGVGAGTVTSIQTGPGLQGGPITAAGTIQVAPEGIQRSMVAPNAVGSTQIDSAEVQRRVVGTCNVGQVITAINADGSVGCADTAVAPRQTLIRSGTIAAAVFGTISPSGLPYFVTSNDNSSTPVAQWVGCSKADCTSLPRVTRLSPATPGSAPFRRTSAMWVGGLPVLIGTEGTATGFTARLDYCTDLACSSVTSRIIGSTASTSGGLTTSSQAGIVPADGRPAVLYKDQTPGVNSTYLAKCNDISCTSRTLTVVIENTGPATFGAPSLVPTPNGGLMMAGGFGVIVTAPCADPLCSSLGPLSTLPSGGLEAAFPFVASGSPDGRPLAAFLDQTFRVRVFKCADASCTSGTQTVVVGSAEAIVDSADIAIAFGTDGLPLLSVNARINGLPGLSVLHCADVECQSIDQSVFVGAGSSSLPNPIVVPSGGRPVVATGGLSNFGAITSSFYACGTRTCE